MKILTVSSVFIGGRFNKIQVGIDPNQSLKQLVDENRQELLPWHEKFDIAQSNAFGAWENINDKTLNYFNSFYRFAAFQNPTRIPVHLIDKISRLEFEQVAIGNADFSHDDSISFFVFEKYDEVLDAISQGTSDDYLRESIQEFLERLLSETESQILIDKFSQSRAERKMYALVTQLIPAQLWTKLKTPPLDYYRKFILHAAIQIMNLDYCVRHVDLDDRDIFEDISRGWVINFLYKIQNQMLVVLNIPETFLRNIYPSRAGFSDLLKNIGVENHAGDNNYYATNIVNKSISEIYFEIFNDLTIDNYEDYIEFCTTAPLSDINLRKIVHTYRVLFNKLKHSSYVQIINSRDYETIRKRELEEIKCEIEKLQTAAVVDEPNKEDKLAELEIKKEIAEKVRYSYGHLDFQDSQFKRNNGITVVDEQGMKFSVTLLDLEISLKVLFGILCVIDRGNATRIGQNAT